MTQLQSYGRRTTLALASALVTAAAGAQPSGTASRGALASGTWAVTNVHVIPMTADTVLRDAVVFVRDGRIASVGSPRDVQLPDGVRRIDGGGGYLLPELADVHTHLFADTELPDSVAPYELAMMVANGVTAARLMIGRPGHFALRDAIARGTLLGPQLWVASPEFVGRPSPRATLVDTPEAARTAVREAKAAGYDFIKITTGVMPPAYEALVAEAARVGIRVVGHVDPAVGIHRALATGQQVEHLDAYFEAVLADSVGSRASVTQAGLFRLDNWRTLDHVDDVKVTTLAGATARAPGWGRWFSPTLNVFNDAFAVGPTDRELHARAEWSFLPPRWKEAYSRARVRYWAAPNDSVRTPARRQRFIEVRNRLVRAIVDSGGRLIAGSDTPEWFHLYGWGLHRELASYVTAGLSPYRALEAATRNAAEFLGAEGEWGTIARGRRADLLLVRGDPTRDITQLQQIAGVSVGGRWLGRDELDALVRRGAAVLGGAGASR